MASRDKDMGGGGGGKRKREITILKEIREELLVDFGRVSLVVIHFTEHLTSCYAQLYPEQEREEGAGIHTAHQT